MAKTKIGNRASYITIAQELKRPLTTKRMGNGVNIDYNSDGEIYGIEILSELDVEYYSDYIKRDKDEV